MYINVNKNIKKTLISDFKILSTWLFHSFIFRIKFMLAYDLHHIPYC